MANGVRRLNEPPKAPGESEAADKSLVEIQSPRREESPCQAFFRSRLQGSFARAAREAPPAKLQANKRDIGARNRR